LIAIREDTRALSAKTSPTACENCAKHDTVSFILLVSVITHLVVNERTNERTNERIELNLSEKLERMRGKNEQKTPRRVGTSESREEAGSIAKGCDRSSRRFAAQVRYSSIGRKKQEKKRQETSRGEEAILVAFGVLNDGV